jgi:peptidoglycan/xylan/chitin deacetylase (PgdA/CDA1 family)
MSEGPARDLVGYGRKRPLGRWPNGARLVISLVVNYEEGSERSLAMGDPDQEAFTEWGAYALPPEIRNLGMESTFEYGSRVGIWRIFELLESHDVKATFFSCAVALEQNRDVAEAISGGDHCVVGHGYRWEEVFRLSREAEKEHIRLAVESFKRTLGRRPRGWYCRYSPSVHTRDLLVAEGGFDYDCDAYNDDLPYFVATSRGRHLVIPYSSDNNDTRFWHSGMVVGRHFSEYLMDAFEVLYRESARGPVMMSVGLHPRIIGRPGRIGSLDHFIARTQEIDGVTFMTRDEIATMWLEAYRTS